MKFVIKHFRDLTTNELYEILKTRFEIFVTEQECIYQDLGDKDQDAYHVFCWNDNGRVAGCLRVFWKDEAAGVAQIGRVVTLEHGLGIGGQMLHQGVELAIQKLHAKEGFEVVSEPFMEDGIPHVQMEMTPRDGVSESF